MRFWIVSMAFGLLVGSPIPAQAQTAEIQKEVQDKLTAEKKTLEDLLSQALRNNPDLRVAQAKLHEAEAELNRVVLQVSQKVVVLHRGIAQAREAVKAASQRYQRLKKLYETGAVSHEEFSDAELKNQKVRYELAIQEAELSFLLASGPTLPGLGKPLAQTVDPAKMLRNIDEEAIYELLRRELAEKRQINRDAIYSEALRKELKRVPLSADMQEKLRKALDTKAKIVFTDAPPKEVLEFLQQHTGYVFNIVEQLRGDALKDLPRVNLVLRESVPVGAVFQFLQDRYLWHFVIRDYGIVITDAEPPAGAVDLLDFWKNRPAPKTAEK